MRVLTTGCLVLAFGGALQAQGKPAAGSVTVPAAIDQNRVVINADLASPDGSTQTIRAWVDNGNPELDMSRRVATLLQLPVTCGDQECTAPAPAEIMVGGMKIPLGSMKKAVIPLKPVSAAAVLAPGLSAEITIPSTVLRNYDVLIDFPGRKFTIGAPGTIHFLGSSSKVLVNSENGLIQVPSQIENKKYNLALDIGSCTSFLAEELFDKLAGQHPDWPHMTGAVGSANMWGLDDEPKWKLMRVDRVQYGPLFLANVAVVGFPKERMAYFSKRAGVATVGLLGSNIFLNYRVGLDYAHSMAYFDIGRLFKFPDFDVVGLVLRPEDDGRFTIIGVADFDGKPSVPVGPGGVETGDHIEAVNDIPLHSATMGQVWSALRGTPGQERKLTIEREGKQISVAATVRHFLAESPDTDGKKRK